MGCNKDVRISGIWGRGQGGWHKDVLIGVYGAGIRMYTLGWNNDVRIGIRMYALE